MKIQEIAEKFGISFVQDCSANNVHVAKEGKAACNSRYRVFQVSVESVSWIGCSRCSKKIEKLGQE